MDSPAIAISTRTTPSGWSLLLGDEAPRRIWLQRMLVAYGLFLLMQGVRALGLGLAGHPLDALSLPLVYDLCWMSTCFVLVRTGTSARFDDPALTLPQVLAALLSVALSYALVDVGRGAALPLMAVTLALSIYHLSPRQILCAGGVALSVMAICLWAMDLVAAPGIDSSREALSLLTAVVCLPGLAWGSHQARRLRHHQTLQRAALQDAMTRLGALTTQDELTGLINHRHMQDLLTAECKRHSRGCRPFCVALLDINQLRDVNQHHGRPQGDEVVRQLAQLSETHLRESDVVARWHGEEFMILMPETDLDGGIRSLERLRDYLHTRWGFYHEGRWVPMNCSAGLTVYRAGESATHLLERVEHALHAAQARGRDQVVSA